MVSPIPFIDPAYLSHTLDPPLEPLGASSSGPSYYILDIRMFLADVVRKSAVCIEIGSYLETFGRFLFLNEP